MSHDTIRYKLQKYEGKLSTEGNQYKKALYAEKIGHYRSLLQSGGGGFADVINKGHSALDTEITSLTALLAGKNTPVDPKAISDIQELITGLKDNFTDVKKDMTTASIAYAQYNAQVRRKLRDIQTSANAIQPFDAKQLDGIKTLATQMSSLNIQGMEHNAELISLLGQLEGDSNDNSRATTLNDIHRKVTSMQSASTPVRIDASVSQYYKDIVNGNNATHPQITALPDSIKTNTTLVQLNSMFSA
jgi:hypothetical protein